MNCPSRHHHHHRATYQITLPHQFCLDHAYITHIQCSTTYYYRKESNEVSGVFFSTIKANLISDKEYLQQAASKGHLKICQFLISLGANIDLQDTEGNTPLLNAIQNIKKDSRHLDIVKMLLEKGASPNIANNEKNVPLHFANSKELAELLLKNGAKPDFKNNQNQTPKDMAFQNKLQEINELMIQYETRATDKELNNCIICFNPKNGTFAFLPCGHAKTCENCCKRILQPANQQHECPTCRQPVTNYHKIFI